MSNKTYVQTDPQRFATLLVDDSDEWESAAQMIAARDRHLLNRAVADGIAALMDMWTVHVAALGVIQTHDPETYERLSEKDKRIFGERMNALQALITPS